MRQLAKRLLRHFTARQHVFFLHIAKCGGISVNNALKRHFPFDWIRINARGSLEAARSKYGFANPFEDNYAAVLRFREDLLLYFMACEVRYISGHVAFSETAFRAYGDRYQHITLLRHPVDRYISHYRFNARKESASPWKIDEGLAEFTASKRGREAGADLVKHIGGVRDDGDYHAPGAVLRATENLDHFAAVGVLEDLEDFERQVRARCGLKLRIGHKNKTPGRETLEISDALLRQVESVCTPDIQVYEVAVSRFVRR